MTVFIKTTILKFESSYFNEKFVKFAKYINRCLCENELSQKLIIFRKKTWSYDNFNGV